VKRWEILADNLSKAGWTWGCTSTINSNGQTIFVTDAHRDDERRFIVHADEKFSAFLGLQRAVCIHLLNLEPADAIDARLDAGSCAPSGC
jgi:hypothetical protein